MGRSTKSCFKIITCGSDSVDRDDLQVSESKASTDKRGWSFRKRSARHRVLSNTVISEAPSSVNKDSPESAGANYQTQAKAAVPEKSSEMQWTDEMAQLSTSINAKFPESIALAETETELNVQPDESVVTVIQSAIRKFLAEKELLKQKNIVKLQAAVRGHLVRRHAVGSLRCVQAIIKMQVLVRARHIRRSAVKSTNDQKLDVKLGKEARKSGANPDIAYTSIEKLLSNRFARQLLESSPKTKSMNIKCDSSRPDSAWKWLERWASVSPKEMEQSVTSEPDTELQEESVNHPKNQLETICPDEEDSVSVDLNSGATLATVPYLNPDSEEAAVPSESLVSHKLEHPNPESSDLSKSTENSHQLLIEDKQSDSIPQTEFNFLSSKPDLEDDQPKRSMKRVASEQPETEGQRVAFGSRKASNAAFIAAQSKFEELTSTSNSVKSISISNHENEVETCENTVTSSIENTSKTRDTNLADFADSSASKVVVGGSECGTELSISSTLDSPDRSEVGAAEQEVNVPDEGLANHNNNTYTDVELKVDNPIIHDTDLSNLSTVQSEKRMNDEGAIAAESSVGEEKLEENASNMQIKLEHEAIDQKYKSSPGASPRSHVTVQEFQTTPSSDVSTKSRKMRREKNGSSQKRKSLSVGKQSPVPSNDSSVRHSLEQLPKDLKAGKRRNSFGLPKSDDVDQEPRDSSSSHSLPSYMQATESARAKAYANVSPRSSPDVQDKESYIKKRHSLPGANGRQGSPRIQRSMSQAQQSTKGNGNNPPQERKWQR